MLRAMLLPKPWMLFRSREDADEPSPEEAAFERRRYPAPDFEIGLVHAAKIAGILAVPLSVIAAIFGVYLNGFRADIRLDMRTIVTEAIEKHIAFERATYATSMELQNLREEVKRLQVMEMEQQRTIDSNTRYLERIGQRIGVPRNGS